MNNSYKFNQIYSNEQTKLIETEFSRLAGHYYLEHAGATLYSNRQIAEIAHQFQANLYANPHSSKSTDDAIDIIRYQILTHFKTNPEDYSVIFTSGATAALKLIAENFNYQNGLFAYLQDNHTSVLGMRAYAPNTKCVGIDEAFHLLNAAPNEKHENSNSLFVFPAQSNFSGGKYALAWIEEIQKGALKNHTGFGGNWFVALDAAAFVSTNELDLARFQPDFVTISFYKIFGYPTGLGALLVKNASSHVLKKRFYGGGTVLMAQSATNQVVMRDTLHERFEDGTLPFLSIVALKEGFNTLKRLNLDFGIISRHTFSLAQFVYKSLASLHHYNGRAAVILYHSNCFSSLEEQGAIVNFNILRENGDYVGYSEVLHFANLYGIHLRTGCFCNPGACQYFLKLAPEDVQRHFDVRFHPVAIRNKIMWPPSSPDLALFISNGNQWQMAETNLNQAGHVCGDQHDLVDGYPTGSVRVSFGYMSTKNDADKFLEMIRTCFVSQPIRSSPDEKSVKKNHLAPTQGGILEEIILYPIKSCGGFSVGEKWPLTPTGLKYDRQWMIINPAGVCVSQKTNRKLCLIRPEINLETKIMTLSYPGQKEIRFCVDSTLSVANSGSLCQSKVCGDKIQGWDCGEEVSDWLSTILGARVRLLQQCTEMEEIMCRTSRENEKLHLSLANKAQYLLVNVASVQWLRDRIPKDELNESFQSTIQRFRPNFVVKFDEAFVENNYKQFHFDESIFETEGMCTRCQMICIDQTTGKTSKEPLQTLSKSFKGKIAFGIYLNRLKQQDNYIQVGATVCGHIKH